MPRQIITPIESSPRGATVSLASVGLAADGNAIPADGNVIALYHNASGAGNNINFVSVASTEIDGYALTTTPGQNAPVGGTLVLGPCLMPNLLIQSDGRIWIDHGSGDAQLKVAAIRLPVVRGGEALITATPPVGRVIVPPVTVHAKGANLAWIAASANGHAFANSGATYLLVNNQSASALVVPISIGGKIRVPNSTADFAVTLENLSVGANSMKVFGPFRPDLYNQPDGSVYFGIGPQSSVTAATFEA